jgi:hypothetical protein
LETILHYGKEVAGQESIEKFKLQVTVRKLPKSFSGGEKTCYETV